MPENATPASTDAAWRGAGALLITVSVLEVAAMAHHPTVHTPDLAEAVRQMRALSTQSAWVHGVLIALMLTGFVALTEFARSRNLARPLLRAGLIAYALGVVAMTGAAMVDGFITPGVAEHAPGADMPELQVTARLLTLCMLFNQALAKLGTVGLSAGITAWSADLLRGTGLARALGVAGILVGVACAGAMLSGSLHLDVHGMMAVLVMQALWTIGVGVLMLIPRSA